MPVEAFTAAAGIMAVIVVDTIVADAIMEAVIMAVTVVDFTGLVLGSALAGATRISGFI